MTPHCSAQVTETLGVNMGVRVVLVTLLVALTCVFVIPVPYTWKALHWSWEKLGNPPIKDLRPRDAVLSLGNR